MLFKPTSSPGNRFHDSFSIGRFHGSGDVTACGCIGQPDAIIGHGPLAVHLGPPLKIGWGLPPPHQTSVTGHDLTRRELLQFVRPHHRLGPQMGRAHLSGDPVSTLGEGYRLNHPVHRADLVQYIMRLACHSYRGRSIPRATAHVGDQKPFSLTDSDPIQGRVARRDYSCQALLGKVESRCHDHRPGE